jgi:hypothetical protein
MELADRLFFETLVRVHRAGERAPFTGLKPAGRDLRPAIPAADKAIEEGSVESVVKLLTAAMQEQLREHFNEVVRAKAYRAGDIAAGREYVKTTIALAKAADFAAIRTLLEDSSLPLAGLQDHLATTVVARQAGRMVGTAALEFYADGALSYARCPVIAAYSVSTLTGPAPRFRRQTIQTRPRHFQ